MTMGLGVAVLVRAERGGADNIDWLSMVGGREFGGFVE